MISKKIRKKAKNKHAQIKMFENIGIMIIFFFLLSFGLSFYSRYQNKSLANDLAEAGTQSIIKTSKKIYYLPEFKCSSTEVESCIDLHKLKAFAKLTDTDPGTSETRDAFNYYYNIFQTSVVSVEQLFPPGEEPIQIYYNPLTKNIRQMERIIIPISIHDSVNDVYNYGILNITLYLKVN